MAGLPDESLFDDGLDISADLMNEVQKVIADPLAFISQVLKIQDKLGRVVPFVFNKAQLKLHEEIERQRAAGQPVRIIILKARQMGFFYGDFRRAVLPDGNTT